MPPRLQPLKMFGDEEGLLKSGVDPAEESLQAAKKFMSERKKERRRKQREDNEVAPETTETDWEDEGGSIIEEDEVYVNEEEVKEILNSGKELDLEREPDDAFGRELHPLSLKFLQTLKEVQRLHFKKGADYGTKEDPFHNIRDGCEEFGIAPWKAAAKAANDPMVRIKNYAKTGKLENESVRDSFLDAANFMLIALVLWEEENGRD